MSQRVVSHLTKVREAEWMRHRFRQIWIGVPGCRQVTGPLRTLYLLCNVELILPPCQVVVRSRNNCILHPASLIYACICVCLTALVIILSIAILSTLVFLECKPEVEDKKSLLLCTELSLFNLILCFLI